MIHSTLAPLGLNQKEITLYLELLALGAQAASVLARKLGQPRSSTQFIAESLVKKGVATKQQYRHITIYQPLDPAHLVRLLEGKKHEVLNEYRERTAAVESIVPQLQELQGNSYVRPQARFFEGREGIKRVLEDSLAAREPIRSLANFEERDRCLPGYFADYDERRAAKGVCSRTIAPDNESGGTRQGKDAASHRELRLVSREQYEWLPEIQFYDDKITIASGSDLVGLIIEGTEISRAMKVLFDLAWNGILLQQESKEQQGKKAE